MTTGSISLGRFFNFSWSSEREGAVTVSRSQRGASRDMTGGLQVNETMLRGLYHGDFPGLQFASPLCYTPINMLVQMMGYPTPHSEDERTQEALNLILAQMSERIPRIHRSAFVTGNAWRFPRWSLDIIGPGGAPGALVWEAVPDASICDVLMDIQSEEILKILTDEHISLRTGENRTIVVQRKRTFDPATVLVKFIGDKPASVQDYSAVNVSGRLPVNFANDADEGEVRGHAIMARSIRVLKDYHDIAYRISETLAKFKVKQVQEAEDPAQWRKENGLESDADMDEFNIADNDFVLNRKGCKTEYMFVPESATAALEKALERNFLLVVEGSGMPELYFGPMATGNHASTDINREQLVNYADSKRQSFNSAYKALFAGSLQVMSIATGQKFQDFDMRWNRVDNVSPQMRSNILRSFAQAASALVGSAACTPEQLFHLWELNFPETNPGQYEEWLKGIAQMALHKAASGADYGAASDFAAAKDEPTDEEDAAK